ncbi:PHP domain-containing protein [Clostridium tarantellae]|uniref:PHP domain-containing protein n=1 Tax=Clostridium tarantellae TaxID=39493 RepID=A0A6I1MK09_9CLOT|nr:PHP domain-containing protein [Clostridium tarantellae]MPQ42502.1 PHP domain-containing protein [Clostridium tarantellae]
MKKVKTDLHIHTKASDGTLTPIELISEIKEKNIKMFSVTDHNSIDSIDEILNLTKDGNIKFIPGVEISSKFNDEQIHILAYNFDLKNKELIELIKNNHKILNEEDDESIKMLIERGFPLDFEEYLNYTYDVNRGGWKTLNYLIDKGICSGVEDFFSRIFTDDRKLKCPNFPHAEDIIRAIKKANGIAILAHPSYGNTKYNIDEILENFRIWGVDGLECSHPNHSKEIISYLKEYCKKNNLLITGGSDYHGGLLSKRTLGRPEFYADLNLLDKN